MLIVLVCVCFAFNHMECGILREGVRESGREGERESF